MASKFSQVESVEDFQQYQATDICYEIIQVIIICINSCPEKVGTYSLSHLACVIK